MLPNALRPDGTGARHGRHAQGSGSPTQSSISAPRSSMGQIDREAERLIGHGPLGEPCEMQLDFGGQPVHSQPCR